MLCGKKMNSFPITDIVKKFRLLYLAKECVPPFALCDVGTILVFKVLIIIWVS